MHSCIPSQPLTDKRIEVRALQGWYGSNLQKFYKSLENGKKLLKQRHQQQLKRIQQQIDDLIT